ncbi:MAG: type II secretion system F family protein [Planctomycetota bacterium]|nr:type II secretion system F family protein [Planctomycetota bacterium]MDA1114627.1 type II secretion system F family protein [Planctomycetota bacterium]
MARIQRKVPAASRPSGGSSQADGPAREGSVLVKRKVPLKHIVQFTRMLATMTEAGLPILRNLRILADQWPEGRFKDSILDAGDLVEEGQPLSDALAQTPEVFDELYVNMARAGEAGGVLDKVFDRLANFLERSQAVRDKTKSALTYPIVIFVVAISVVSALMLFVIPKFAELYVDMDMELPKLTQFMIDTSEFMQRFWYLILGLPTLLWITHMALYRRGYGYRRNCHSVFLRLPVIGALTEKSQVSRFATTFGTLIASGVPHLEAFDITRGALTNEVYRESIDDIQEEVREGEAIAASLASTGRFDDLVVAMVEVGEETGELDRMCMRIGESYEEQYTRSLDNMLKLIEPIMLIVLAGLVGSIALALFLPLFKLLEEFGAQA